jgi:hypothetical protein
LHAKECAVSNERRIWNDLVRLSDQLKLALRDGSALTQAAGLASTISYRTTGVSALDALSRQFDELDCHLRAALQIYLRACDSLETLGSDGAQGARPAAAAPDLHAKEEAVHQRVFSI